MQKAEQKTELVYVNDDAAVALSLSLPLLRSMGASSIRSVVQTSLHKPLNGLAGCVCVRESRFK